MIARMLSGRRVPAALQRIDRPQAIALTAALAVTAAIGWLASPVVLAVAVGIELAAGGLGAVALMGPSRPGLGIGRYTTLALAGVSAALAGRLIPGGVSLLFVPLLAVMLWAVLWLELRASFDTTERTALDLALTAILFATAAGIGGLLGNQGWPPPLGLVLVVGLLLSLRSAEARGEGGVQAIGQALLHTLAIGQVAVAVVVLRIPGLVGPALVALAFYVWGGAADALGGGATPRSVAFEFGSLALLGFIVAVLMAHA